jgi:transcriptional regulator
LKATKRRNFEGCKNTVDTTIDGRSPVEVTFTAGTTITVTPNILQEEDNLGGINLNVN